jgi:Right handed beta helix region
MKGKDRRRSRLSSNSLFALLTLLCMHNALSCENLQPKSTGRIEIAQPGNYCLKVDSHVDGEYAPIFSHGSDVYSRDDVLLVVGASKVTLDLQKHTVSSDAILTGGGIETPTQTGGKIGMLNEYPHARYASDITIRNGNVVIKRYGIGIRVMGYTGTWTKWADAKLPQQGGSEVYGNDTEWPFSIYTDELGSGSNSEYMIGVIKRSFERDMAFLPKTPSAYPQRNIKIEDMNVLTRDVGVVVQGGNTVIKNSVIEVEAGTAIWIYGPNAVIENNTIIVHGTNKLRPADAPIRLHHGDGAVIRNNTIIIAGKAHQRAVSTFDTGTFTFDNNTIVGLDDLKQTAEAFTGTLQMNATNNQLDNSMWTRMKSWLARMVSKWRLLTPEKIIPIG